MVDVRDAVIADAEALAVLLKSLDQTRSVESIQEEMELGGTSAAHVVVAVETKAVVGLAAFAVWRAFAEQMWVCRLSAIAVQPEYRGAGIGRLLVHEVERQAQAASCSVVELSSGRRQERATAHALYASLGYEDASSHHAMYRKMVSSDDRCSHG